MFSSTLLYPFQTVQSRIIMQGLSNNETCAILAQNSNIKSDKDKVVGSRLNMIKIIENTYRFEGIRGFFKGYGPGISKVILGNAISFGLYEKIKELVINI